MNQAPDLWHYPRAELASQIMGMFSSNLSSSLTLFAPRRKGKTEFLRKDITPLAEHQGWRVFYFSFLDAGDDTAAKFAHALSDFAQPQSLLKKAGNLFSRVGKVSTEVTGIKAEMELSQPQEATTGVLASIKTLAEGKQPVLLLLDEIQALASRAHAPTVASLRTALDLHKDNVKVIFTGSSREGLRKMFSSASAPFFHFSQNFDFPDLGRGFTDHLADAHQRVSSRTLDKEALWQAFVDMQRTPQFARLLVERLTLNPHADITSLKNQILEEVTTSRDFADLWDDLNAIERALLAALASGSPALYSQPFKNDLALQLGVDRITTPNIQSALRSLMNKGFIHQQGSGRYSIEEALFADWILHH